MECVFVCVFYAVLFQCTLPQCPCFDICLLLVWCSMTSHSKHIITKTGTGKWMCYVLLGCNEKEISGSITEFLSQYCQFAVKCPRACCLSESTTDQLSEFHFQYKKAASLWVHNTSVKDYIERGVSQFVCSFYAGLWCPRLSFSYFTYFELHLELKTNVFSSH